MIDNPDRQKTTQSLSAYEKAALGGNDPRCVPLSPKILPVGADIISPDYSEQENQIWKTLYKRQVEVLPGRAAKDFIHGLEVLDLPSERVPKLSVLSKTLSEVSNWQVARTPGLLHEELFFECLSKRIFPSTDYIRGSHELDYTPAPDGFHDIFGHMPILCEPSFADFYQEYGRVSLNATGDDRRRLERFYWFTAEFGLIREAEGLRIYGNGILSSYEETFYSLSDKVDHRAFDPYQMAEQEYDVWHMQPLLYVIESYEELKSGFQDLAKKLGV